MPRMGRVPNENRGRNQKLKCDSHGYNEVEEVIKELFGK